MSRRWGYDYILAESNAMGDPIIEQLKIEGLTVEGFQTTAVSKPQIIDNLSLAFERVDAKWLDDPIWTAELESYERTVLPSGKFKYGAPEGFHDDTVIARALALWAADNRVSFTLGSLNYG
jgi:hypothetical protein